MVVNRKRQNKNHSLHIRVSFYSFSRFYNLWKQIGSEQWPATVHNMSTTVQANSTMACTLAAHQHVISMWLRPSLMTFFSVREEDTAFVMHRSFSLIKSMKVSVLLSSQDVSHLLYYLQRLVCCFNRNINYTWTNEVTHSRNPNINKPYMEKQRESCHPERPEATLVLAFKWKVKGDWRLFKLYWWTAEQLRSLFTLYTVKQQSGVFRFPHPGVWTES